MTWAWGDFWQRSRNWLRVGWLITAGLIALYIGVIEPWQIAREMSYSRAAGLAAVAGDSILPWRQASYIPTFLLWLATLLIGAAIGWRILRWSARILFMSRKAETVRGEAR